jgi:subtilisin family serine protease
MTELDRKPSSCPYLFTWNGTRFEFVTDFLGGGEIGDWVAPSAWNHPDPDEYVRIRGDQLAPRDGRYELRVTNELEEAMFLDRVQLLVIDHPRPVEVFPNEGLRDPPRPAFRIHATRGAHPPLRATDDHGHGSNTTGIIAANRNNGRGVAGMLSGVRILVCKILNSSNSGLTSHVIAATTYARRLGVPVMNLSLQNYPFSSTLNAELEQRVVDRTARLDSANKSLEAEIAVRQQAERAQRKSQQLIQAVIDNSPAVIYVKDLQGRY